MRYGRACLVALAQMDADAELDATLRIAAVMHGDGGIGQIASQRSEAGKCPLLVGPGKLAESDHIRRKKAASFRVSAMALPSPHARLA